MKKTFLLPIVAALMCACGGNNPSPNPNASTASSSESGTESKSNIHAFPGECPADQPADLAAYFDSLHTQCNAYVNSHNGSSDSAKIWQDVAELDHYAKGQRKYYPDKEVRHALDACAFELGYAYSHGPIEGDTADDCEVFFFRFLEQAARLSPKVDYVTTFHSPKGDAGILRYHEWSPNPLYSFLVYPKSDNATGYNVQMVGARGEVAITKLYPLTDSEGHSYYLCSNNEENFAQYLYMREGDGVTLVAKWESDPEFSPTDDATIYFNSKALRWNLCSNRNGILHAINGTPMLTLTLAGKESAFAKTTFQE